MQKNKIKSITSTDLQNNLSQCINTLQSKEIEMIKIRHHNSVDTVMITLSRYEQLISMENNEEGETKIPQAFYNSTTIKGSQSMDKGEEKYLSVSELFKST